MTNVRWKDKTSIGNAVDTGDTMPITDTSASNADKHIHPEDLRNFVLDKVDTRSLSFTKGSDITAASPLVIPATASGGYFDVTGATGFSAMTVDAGRYFVLQFDGAATITHGSGIVLPGAANYTTIAGDRLICYATGTNVVDVLQIAGTKGIGLPLTSGTVMLFFQSAAPIGWTQVTNQNNKAFRVVSGTGGGTGGTDPFTTVFGLTAVDGTSVSTAQLAVHNHGDSQISGGGTVAVGGGGAAGEVSVNAGSGDSHAHGIELRVQYIDIIIASKD